MARKLKRLDNYPHDYIPFIEQAALGGEAFVEVEARTEMEKKNLKITIRSQLYSYLAAIRAEAKEGNMWAIRHEEYAKRTAVRMEENGVRLIPKSDTTIAALLRRSTDSCRAGKGMESVEAEKERECKESAERLMEKYGVINQGKEE